MLQVRSIVAGLAGLLHVIGEAAQGVGSPNAHLRRMNAHVRAALGRREQVRRGGGVPEADRAVEPGMRVRAWTCVGVRG